MSHKCPKCQRMLYNRRLTHCGVCGAEIPESLRFTTQEIAALEQELAKLEQRRKQRQRSADIAEEERELKRREEQIKALLHTGF
jgi:DNA-directed RNA polymerase subunit M/transcription elongation factor TFIIS